MSVKTAELSEAQEVLEIPPVTLHTDPRGVLEFSVADLEDFDPERRVVLTGLSHALGSYLGPLRSSRQATSDPILGLHQEDFKGVTRRAVEGGIYIDSDDPRYSGADQLIKTDFRRGERIARQIGLLLMYPVEDHPGVVFPADEYPLVARSHADLIRAVRAKTNRNQQTNPDRKEARETVQRTAAHVSAAYKEKLIALEARYIEDTKDIISLERQATSGSQARYKAKNLDIKRKHVHELVHQTIDTAATNNGWDEKELRRFHKVFDKYLYRDMSDKTTREAWHVALMMQFYYTNARRLMAIKSLEACGSQYSLYRPALDREAARQAP